MSFIRVPKFCTVDYTMAILDDEPQPSGQRETDRPRQTRDNTSSSKPHQCPHCSMRFRQKGNLVSHIRTHTGERPYECPQCPKSFSQQSTLNGHIAAHKKEKKLKYDNCQKLFTSTQTLNRYTTACNGNWQSSVTGVGRYFFIPPDTNKISLTALDLFDSYYPYSFPDEPQPSAQCDEGRNTQRNDTSCIDKPHKCPHCSKRFKQKGNLVSHIRTHTGEKPHQCPQCSKRFSQQSSLREHIPTHKGEKQFQCENCQMWFASTKTLDRHMKSCTSTVY